MCLWVLREGGRRQGVATQSNHARMRCNQCMTGFTDEFLLETAKFFNENDHVISKVIPPLSLFKNAFLLIIVPLPSRGNIILTALHQMFGSSPLKVLHMCSFLIHVLLA